MIFSKRYLQKNYHVSLNGQSIEFVNSITYLCVILKNDLLDSDEIEYQNRNLCVRSNILSRNFLNCESLIKNKLFQSAIYGLGLWQFYKRKNINNFKVCYNNAFRYSHGYFR